MDINELQCSLRQYNEQLKMVMKAISDARHETDKVPLMSLQSDLNQLIQLTQESIETISCNQDTKAETVASSSSVETSTIDDEYALFMEEMTKSGAYDQDKAEHLNDGNIEEDLEALLGMKCSVFHTHKWGGQPTQHNAMVSAIEPHDDNLTFNDLHVRVLFTHPTHAEMLPCPFFLNGECRFDDEKCRYSHGSIVQLSALKEAVEPNFDAIKLKSVVLVKLKPPDDEDISLTKKSSEKYHLWHRGVIKSLNPEENCCIVKLENTSRSGDKRRSDDGEINISLENIFPLNDMGDDNSSSDSDSLSDTEYPESKFVKSENENQATEQNIQQSCPGMGDWERHTRGIGSKLMIAMGYKPGTGLGAASDGRVQPVEARVLPTGKSLDQCMAISEKNAGKDSLKLEQRLKRMQKKQEERLKRSYEKAKEQEKSNVFNFLNKTLGDSSKEVVQAESSGFKNSSTKDLNIEQFKLGSEAQKLERDIARLTKQSHGSISRSLDLQLNEKTKELQTLRNKEKQITKELSQRKDKRKMTVF